MEAMLAPMDKFQWLSLVDQYHQAIGVCNVRCQKHLPVKVETEQDGENYAMCLGNFLYLYKISTLRVQRKTC